MSHGPAGPKPSMPRAQWPVSPRLLQSAIPAVRPQGADGEGSGVIRAYTELFPRKLDTERAATQKGSGSGPGLLWAAISLCRVPAAPASGGWQLHGFFPPQDTLSQTVGELDDGASLPTPGLPRDSRRGGKPKPDAGCLISAQSTNAMLGVGGGAAGTEARVPWKVAASSVKTRARGAEGMFLPVARTRTRGARARRAGTPQRTPLHRQARRTLGWELPSRTGVPGFLGEPCWGRRGTLATEGASRLRSSWRPQNKG